MADLVHLLVGAPLDWSQARVACGDTTALHGSFDQAAVTCPSCTPARRPSVPVAYLDWLHLPVKEESATS